MKKNKISLFIAIAFIIFVIALFTVKIMHKADNTNENTQSEYTNKEDEEKNELDDTNISKDTFSFDIAFYRSTKTEKIFYIFIKCQSTLRRV